MTDAPSYPPLDPHSEEGRLRRALHELGQKVEPANKIWRSLSEWMVGEHERHVEGRSWQKVFEPRQISPPGGYQSPKVVAATMSAFFSNVAAEQALGIPMLQTAITAHAILYEIIRYKVPNYYVSDAFIRAVAATDLPKDFTLHDLHWPMPGLVLGFPVQFMREYLGRDVCYIFAADLNEGDHAPPPDLDSVPFVGQHWTVTTPDKVALMFDAWENDGLGSCTADWGDPARGLPTVPSCVRPLVTIRLDLTHGWLLKRRLATATSQSCHAYSPSFKR